jgi:hypothetical protein
MVTFTQKQVAGETLDQQPYKGLREQVIGQPEQVKMPQIEQPWVGLKDQVNGNDARFNLSATTAFEREDSDRSARILKVADQAKLPIDFVERNLDKLEKDVAKKGFNAKEYRKNNPVVSEWLSQNPHYFSAAKDDLTILEQAENIVKGMGERASSLLGGFAQLSQMATGAGTPPLIAGVDSMEQLAARTPGGESVEEAAQRLRPTEQQVKGLENLLTEAADRISDTDFGYEEYTSWDDFKESPLVNFIPFALEQGLVSAPDMAAAIVSMPAYAAARTGEVARNRAEMDMRESPTAGDFLAALPAATADALLERFSAKYLVGLDGPVGSVTQIPGRIGGAALREGATEFAQESIEQTATTLGTETGFDLGRTLEAGAAGLVGGAGFGGIARGTTAPVQLAIENARGRQRKKFFESLGENAQNSKLRERVPEKYREVFDRLTKDGPVEKMFIPEEAHREYWQSQGIDPVRAAEEVFGDSSYYTEAANTGGMMEVPTALYAERVAADGELNGFYQDNATFDPTEMTVAEFERAQQEAENLDVTEEVGEAESVTAEQRIYQDIFGQLQQTTSREVADSQARYVATVFRTLGQRSGMDPYELYQSRNLRVRRDVPESLRQPEQLTNLDYILNAVRDDALPTEQEIYGPRFVDIMRRQGIVDDGGELSARDVDANQVGRNRMLRDSGQWTLDDAAERAFELGIITENDQTQLLELVDRELSGERVTIPDQFNEQLATQREYADSLMEYLESIDVDINELTNQQVAAIILGEAQPSDFAGGEVDDGVTLEQSAFHGTPYRFDRFSLEAIGSGEGAQAYGWGLYFAQSESIAQFYRDAGIRISPSLRMVWEDNEYDTDATIAEIEQLIESGERGGAERWQPVLEELQSIPEGSLYQVDVPENTELLDWEAKLDDQPEQVKQAIDEFVEQYRDQLTDVQEQINQLKKQVVGQPTDEQKQEMKRLANQRSNLVGMTGESVYRRMSEQLGGDREASMYLNERGVKGLRYRDAMSRVEGDADTRSFVIWDDAAVTIEAVNGELIQANQVELNQARQEAYDNENLLVVHNIKSEGIRFANKLGGLAAPSIAVVDVTKGGFDNFGDISLIADPSLLESPKVRTFDADVYSPRQPRAVYEIDDKAYQKWSKRWGEAAAEIGVDNYPQWHDLEEGPSAIVFNSSVAYDFLKSIGKAPKPVKVKPGQVTKKLSKLEVSRWNWREKEQAVKDIVAAEIEQRIAELDSERPQAAGLHNDLFYNDDGSLKDSVIERYVGQADAFSRSSGIDRLETEKKIRRLMNQKTNKAAFENYVESTFTELEKNKQIFKGFNNAGDRVYSSYTLDNVVKYMTRKLQGGEEFNYNNAGALRSTIANELRSVQEVAANRDRIVSAEEFETMKEEAEQRLDDALVKLKEFYKFDADSWGYTSDAIEAMSEGRKGQREAFEITEESEAIIDDLLNFLRDLPTEYFEAKAQRAVQFNEFQVAVVPNGTPKETIDLLKENGLKIKRYNPNQDGDRQRVIQEAAKREKVLFQKARGTIRFGAETGFSREFTITLNENADLSTFLHEAGHLFLETMFDLDEMENAPQQIKDDVAAILKNMGVESRDQVGAHQHEMFAEWHEQYLREGKAPTQELQSLFATFWSWLIRVYKSMKDIGITGTRLNDEVRGIMDRLVATDAEIDAASSETQQLWESFEESGMTEEEWQAYISEIEESRVQAREEVTQKVMREQARAKKQWYKNEREKVYQEIKADVDQMRVYRALDVLQRNKAPDGSDLPEGMNPTKLSKQGIIDLRGEAYLKRLPRPYVYTRDGGVSPQLFAQQMGYQDAETMLNDIEGARKKSDYINSLVDEEMRQRYGDMLLDGEIPAEALNAVHNERKADVLKREIKSLSRRAGKRAAPIELVRQQAERIINQRRVKDIQPNVYRMAERKASRSAFRAATENNYEEAFKQKQKEMLNHELWKKARDAREFEERVANHMRKLGKKSAQQRIGKAGADYLEQINGILDTYEFKRQSNRELQRRQSLRAWMREKEQNGETLGDEFMVPDEVVDRSQRINYRELPLQELRGVFDMVRQVEHFARTKNRLLQEKAKRDKDEARNELISALEANIPNRGKPPLTKNSMKLRERMSSNARKFDASMLKMEQMIEWLDGGEIDGPWHRLLWDGATDAQALEQDYTESVTKKIAEAVENIPKEVRKRMLDHTGVVAGRRMVRKDIIGVALNVGNKSNYDKLLKGMKWSESDVDAMLSMITKEEWDFIQSVWDTLEGLWPEIAKLEKDITGLEPAKVEPRQVETKYGTYNGGYYPVMYDPNYSEQGELQLSANIGDMLEKGYTRATTPKGHTKERVEGYARPFNLDIDFLTLHTAGVIKDLTHRKWLLDANWIVNDTKIREAINDTLGVEYQGFFKDWVKNVANDRNASNLQTLGIWKRMFEQLRLNMMVATMGFKATTLISQFAGIGPGIEVVGGKEGDGLKWVAKAYGSLVMKPNELVDVWNMVKEKSPEMRYRLQNKDRDIRSALRNVQGKDDLLSQIQNASLAGIGYADLMVTLPTWLAAYNKAQAQGLSEDLSIKAGDRSVRLSQGSGGAKDLASVASRNDTLMRLMTMYYTPFSAMHNRLRNIGHEFGGIKDVPKAFGSVFWLAIVPATIGELLVGRGPEEDEEWAEWMLNTNLSYLTLGVPFLRDIVSATVSEFGYTFTPIAQVGKKTANVGKDLGEVISGDKPKDEAIADLAKATFAASGYWLGVPTSQLEITGGYMYDLATGDDDTENFVEKIMYRREED